MTRALDPEFEGFALRASAALLRTAYLLTGDRGHAEDLLQETLWRTSRRWSAVQSSPEAYARAVLVNLSRDRRRTLSRRVREHRSGEPVAPGGETGHPGERMEMVQLVAQLPRRQREVVALRFFLDLSVADTAAALGMSEGTVKSYTARALAHLRELLDAPAERPAGGVRC